MVDQQQLIRQRLEAFLARRPSAEQLLEQGILGRQEWVMGYGWAWGLVMICVHPLARQRDDTMDPVIM